MPGKYCEMWILQSISTHNVNLSFFEILTHVEPTNIFASSSQNIQYFIDFPKKYKIEKYLIILKNWKILKNIFSLFQYICWLYSYILADFIEDKHSACKVLLFCSHSCHFAFLTLSTSWTSVQGKVTLEPSNHIFPGCSFTNEKEIFVLVINGILLSISIVVSSAREFDSRGAESLTNNWSRESWIDKVQE